MSIAGADVPVYDRLLLAGARLLDEARGADVSTRAICELAGVQAPSLYHHFGSKQGMLDEVVSHGFRSYLAARHSGGSEPADPIAAVREGWDVHVRFGVEHPAFYAHIYGRVEKGKRCGVVADVEAMILTTLEPAARRGRLTVPAATAAAEILAASSGVTLALITASDEAVDWGMSERVRDAVLRSITTSEAGPAEGGRPDVAAAAVTLAATLDEVPDALSPGETAVLKEWLNRLASPARA